LNLLLGAVNVDGPAWMLDERGARFAIILMMTWQFGEGFVVCLGALSEIPRDILEQSQVDGATLWTQFLGVIFPLILPYLVILLARDVLFSLHANFVPAKILGQDGGPNYATTFLPTWIHTNAFSYLRLGYASAMTWVTFLLTLILIAPIFLIATRERRAWKK
jgi:multiple sugar transport system permease protein